MFWQVYVFRIVELQKTERRNLKIQASKINDNEFDEFTLEYVEFMMVWITLGSRSRRTALGM